jgi:hypothetical protein
MGLRFRGSAKTPGFAARDLGAALSGRNGEEDWLPATPIPGASLPRSDASPVTPQPPASHRLDDPVPIARRLRASGGGTVEYRSADADHLASPGLRPLSELIGRILAERSRVSEAIEARLASLEQVRAQARRARGISSALLVSRRRRNTVIAAARAFEDQVAGLRSRLDALAVDADLPLNPQSREAFAALARTFDQLKSSAEIWGVSTGVTINRTRTRAPYAYEVVRTEAVELRAARLPGIESDFDGLCFQTASGAQFFLYPCFLALPRASGGYALMDIRELIASAAEHNGAPDGSYGELQLRSASGLLEIYRFSKPDVASAFATTLSTFIATLPSGQLGALAGGAAAKRARSMTAIPDPPQVPPLMSGGVLLRLALLALIVAAGLALGSPEGRSRAQVLWASAVDQVEQATHAAPPAATAPSAPPPAAIAPAKVAAAATPPAPPATPPAQSPPAAPPATTAPAKVAAAATPPAPPAAPPSAAPAQSLPAVTTIAKAVVPASQSTATAKQNGAAGNPPAPQLDVNRIIELQTKLGELGYGPGEPDGHLGPRTLDAFNQWRRETGRQAVEVIGPDDFAGFMRAISR